MKEEVKKDILHVLKETIIAIEKEDIKYLKDLSNGTLHNANIYQDEYSITTAVLVYSLSKIFERSKYESYKDWPFFFKHTLENLRLAVQELENDRIEGYEGAIQDMLKHIDELKSNLRKYVKEVIYKAHITKGSRFYEHGLSLGKTAELLNVNRFELMEYVGKTGIADVKEAKTIKVRERLRRAREMFK